jgi:hypothetical protein
VLFVQGLPPHRVHGVTTATGTALVAERVIDEFVLEFTHAIELRRCSCRSACSTLRGFGCREPSRPNGCSG